MNKTIILIPSRLGASRLPNKPLLKINNKSLIIHVYEKGKSANIGEVYVATGDQEIFQEVVKNNGKSILTKKKHLTGTDRIYEAYEQLNLNEIDYIYTEVNNEELYENCSLVDEIDRFLKFHNFIRVTTAWHDDLAWGDAFYINKNLISLRVYWFSLLKNFIFKINIFKYINLKFFQLISFIKKRWYRFKQRIKSFI